MPFVNLTPHAIHIQPDGLPAFTVLPSGTVARCAESKNVVGNFEGVELVTNKFGDVYDLPVPVDNTIYIVSMVVRQAIERPDLASPGDLIRDAEGKIVGCRNLVVNR